MSFIFFLSSKFSELTYNDYKIFNQWFIDKCIKSVFFNIEILPLQVGEEWGKIGLCWAQIIRRV